MASPHIAGAAAVLLQANPTLTPDQVRQALQATATPVTAADGTALPFWQVGYGYVDLERGGQPRPRRGPGPRTCPRRRPRADARVLAADGFAVTPLRHVDRTTPPRGTFAGTDSHTYTVAGPARHDARQGDAVAPVARGRRHQRHELHVTVNDAAGRVLGTTTESLTEGAGTATAFIDLRRSTARRSPTARSPSR